MADFSVFISYASVDDQPIPPAESGWVSTLVGILDRYVAMQLGRTEAYSHWFDKQQLQGGQKVEEILEKVRQSKLFVAILSPGWIKSEFCQRELATFIEHNNDNLNRRIFVIERAPIDENETMPDLFRDIVRYKFYAPDDKKIMRTFALPKPHQDHDREYFRLLDDVARDIAERLESGLGVSAQPKGPAVFLAQVTDDLDTHRSEVRRFLRQAGINVLPTSDYRQGREEFEKSFNEDIAKSILFVQLLGSNVGKMPSDVPEGFAWLQYTLAKSKSLPILQWRDPKLDLSTVSLAKQKDLLNLQTVQRLRFEDFRKHVAKEFARLSEPLSSRVPPSDHQTIFINANTVDRETVDHIKKHLDRRCLAWSVPLSLDHKDVSSEEIANDTSENLKGSHGMFVVYGLAPPAWVTSQLRQILKIFPQRTTEPRFVTVVKAPPSPKAPLSIGFPGLKTIDLEQVPEIINGI
jgi:hypothetical protein